MDLLLISRCPPFPLYRGDRLIPYYIARELANRHYRIDLLAFYQQPEDLAEVPRYAQFFNEVILVREPKRSLNSYHQRHRDPQKRFPQQAEESWSPEMWQHVRQAIRTRPYELVHLFGGIQVYEYLNLIRQIPKVIVPYESYSLWLERAIHEERRLIPRWAKQIQHRMARDFESWMFEPYDRVVVLTEHDANMLTALNPETHVAVIPNGVDVDRFSPTGYEPDEPTLLFTGNYDYAPNLDAALRLVRDIFPRVKEAVPRARLCIVGGNPPPELRAYASPHVEITGRVLDVRPYFEQALVFVSPLRLGAGIKNKVLEAMAMATPVVATPLSCDGIPAMPGQHVLLGTTDDELIEQIFNLFRTPQLRRKLARQGRQLVEQQFTWQRVTDLYEELYLETIREHTARLRAGLI
ncbi:MAG: glycosyltransferase [Chloroflexi bacterium]|jgi:glycosyltransferase involved in cell wall biosynthesis|nr:glycosyltransferase [Chloroflexota bacterium]